jgi:hypothetical protein
VHLVKMLTYVLSLHNAHLWLLSSCACATIYSFGLGQSWFLHHVGLILACQVGSLHTRLGVCVGGGVLAMAYNQWHEGLWPMLNEWSLRKLNLTCLTPYLTYVLQAYVDGT